jgi:hypothetical protein
MVPPQGCEIELQVLRQQGPAQIAVGVMGQAGRDLDRVGFAERRVHKEGEPVHTASAAVLNGESESVPSDCGGALLKGPWIHGPGAGIVAGDEVHLRHMALRGRREEGVDGIQGACAPTPRRPE